MPDHLRINVTQHGINVKGAQSGVVDIFYSSVQSGSDHCFRGMAMGRANALPKAIVERVVEIKDDTADQPPLRLRPPALLGFTGRIGWLAFHHRTIRKGPIVRRS